MSDYKAEKIVMVVDSNGDGYQVEPGEVDGFFDIMHVAGRKVTSCAIELLPRDALVAFGEFAKEEKR